MHLDLSHLCEKRNICPVSDRGERTRCKPAYRECENSFLQRDDKYISSLIGNYLLLPEGNKTIISL